MSILEITQKVKQTTKRERTALFQWAHSKRCLQALEARDWHCVAYVKSFSYEAWLLAKGDEFLDSNELEER